MFSKNMIVALAALVAPVLAASELHVSAYFPHHFQYLSTDWWGGWWTASGIAPWKGDLTFKSVPVPQERSESESGRWKDSANKWIVTLDEEKKSYRLYLEDYPGVVLATTPYKGNEAGSVHFKIRDHRYVTYTRWGSCPSDRCIYRMRTSKSVTSPRPTLFIMAPARSMPSQCVEPPSRKWMKGPTWTTLTRYWMKRPCDLGERD